jgi:hypothetical protein
METNRFDELSKSLSRAGSRRSLLKALFAGIAGVAAGSLAPRATSAQITPPCVIGPLNFCCPPQQICRSAAYSVCCPPPSRCLGGQCCAQANICGNTCGCPNGHACVNGVCDPNTASCQDTGCPLNQTCGSNGKCCVPTEGCGCCPPDVTNCVSGMCLTRKQYSGCLTCSAQHTFCLRLCTSTSSDCSTDCDTALAICQQQLNIQGLDPTTLICHDLP